MPRLLPSCLALLFVTATLFAQSEKAPAPPKPVDAESAEAVVPPVEPPAPAPVPEPTESPESETPAAPEPMPAPVTPVEPQAAPEPEPQPAPRVDKAKLAYDDPAALADDLDFHLQGEYFGQMPSPNGRFGYTGLQVVALGDGAFEAVHYEGGLPGGGWNRADRRQLSGRREGDVLVLVGDGGNVVVENGRATFLAADGRRLGSIDRILRVSTRADARPPRGAIVLFDGSGTDHFKNGRMTETALLQVGTEFADAYRDFHLHIEFSLPYMPHARGQGRANSGCYLHGRYEVQILDSFGLEGAANECASLYKQRAPDVNMAFPPLRWQTFDITFTAPRFDAEGNKVANARITVLHNGVPVHDDVEITGKTGNGKPEGPEPLPIKLQDHGNPVVFRNVWLVDRTPDGALVAR